LADAIKAGRQGFAVAALFRDVSAGSQFDVQTETVTSAESDWGP